MMVKTHSSRGARGNYWILKGSTAQFAEDGWDSATLQIAHYGDVKAIFDKATPHDDFAGMFCTAIETGEVWHGDLNLSTIHFLGLIGGATGMVMRKHAEGAQRTERNVTAAEYYGPNATGYGGTTERPLFPVPGGAADAIRFISMQPFVDRQFIAPFPPPTIYSLEALKVGTKVLSIAPPSKLDQQTGISLIANIPSGMLASAIRFAQHPAGVNLWLWDCRWEAVAPREIA